ncbi:uncharacterized protein J3R85_006110 [Psidium guajava]|nr:uncharacterized protein J3R85_006110 [Psidium guajava]
MAPRKRKGGATAPGDEEKPPTVTTKTTVAAAAVSGRVTRSSTRGASAGGPSSNSVPEPPAAKKAKGAGRKKKKKATKEEESVAGEAKGGDGEDREEEVAEDGEVEQAEVGGALDSKAKTVVIEHCKQCNSFKTRAIQVKNGLEKGVPGIIVVVNPDKPRRGCFEIREEGGEIFISLLDMKRPFGPMKALDMDKVILDIIHKVKA